MKQTLKLWKLTLAVILAFGLILIGTHPHIATPLMLRLGTWTLIVLAAGTLLYTLACATKHFSR